MPPKGPDKHNYRSKLDSGFVPDPGIKRIFGGVGLINYVVVCARAVGIGTNQASTIAQVGAIDARGGQRSTVWEGTIQPN